MKPTTLLTYEVFKPLTYHLQSADGRPHLTYFHEVCLGTSFSGGLSFCWSGNVEEPIEVSDGGYGAGVYARIVWPTEQVRATADAHLSLFVDVCVAWLAQFADDVIAGRVNP